MLDEKTLYDKIYACWLGKNIGGTLGAPVEGRMELMNLTWYPKLPENGAALPNDDLDLQLVALHALEGHGTALSCRDLAEEWREHVYFPWDEYGYAGTAMRLGFRPPYSGCFDNVFTDCMGSPIRSELWAAICAGDPAGAARFALLDACVDHAGGEGMYGEMFNAAAEAYAYVCDDIREIIRVALAQVPEHCGTAVAVRCALDCYDQGMTVVEARQTILDRIGSPNFTNAPQNIAFGICGILWGRDFEDAILTTANLGYDTDCTVATAGALLGIMYGTSYIPEKWSAPIGTRVCVSSQIRGMKAPADLDELTRRTLRQYRLHQAQTSFGGQPGAPEVPERFDTQHYTIPEGVLDAEGVTVDLRYSRPTVCPEEACTVTAVLRNNTSWHWKLTARVLCPAGYACGSAPACDILPGEEKTLDFEITAGEGSGTRRSNDFVLVLTRDNDGNVWTEYRLPFVLLTPNVWHVAGKGVKRTAGTRVELDAGERVLETTLFLPESVRGRRTQLICNSPRPIRLEVDGATAFDSPATLYLPAYHRTPRAQKTMLSLAPGAHTVRVTVGEGRAEDAFFTFAVTVTHEVAEPGNFYAITDAFLR